MSGTILRVASLTLLAAALWWAAAAPRSGTAPYYPLGPGMAWEYEVSTPGSDSPPVRVTISNTGRQRVGSWDATIQKMEISGGSSAGYRFAVDAPDFVAMVGEQHPGQSEPTVLDPPQLLLRKPIAVGQHWTSDALATRVNPGTKIPVAVAVESTTDRIQVPAGSFNGCLRVRSAGKIQVSDGGDGSPVEVAVESRLWYAPGVGVVQIQRKESTSRSPAAAVEVLYRLVGRGS